MKQLRPILARGPYNQASHLLLSVSGGMDSMVLLDIFHRMMHVHQAPLGVLHVNHHTGRYSRLAGNLVQAHCRSLDVPCHVVDYRWSGEGNFEREAAQFRRKALETHRHQQGYAVLAHHRNDQLETLLQTLARGAGISTPLGMKTQRDRRLRPLLHISRKVIADHALRAEVPHLEDPSNTDTNRFRNAIRHQITPVLQRFHQSFDGNLSGWLEEYSQLQQDLSREADGYFQNHFHQGVLALEAFRAPVYLWDFILDRFWKTHEIAKPNRSNRNQLHQWLENGETGCFDLGGPRFWCDLDGLALQKPAPEEAKKVPAGEETCWGDWAFTLKQGPSAGICPFSRETDYFTLSPGVITPKRVKDTMRQNRMPHRLRALLPEIIIGDQAFHPAEILELQRRGGLIINHLRGPDPFAWLDRNRGGQLE